MKVTIIGAGSVGSTIAFTLATTGTSSDIVLIDVNEEKAKGEAMDILQGSPFFGSMSIIAGDYPDADNRNPSMDRISALPSFPAAGAVCGSTA